MGSVAREHAAGDWTLEAALDRLAETGWFSEISPQVRALLVPLARVRRYRRGATVYSVGDRPDGVHGLVAGTVDVSIPGEQGLEFTIHRAEPGFWVGDLALFSDAPRLISLRAAQPTVMVYLDGRLLRALAEREPPVLRAVYALNHLNFATALRLVANLGVASSEARIGLRLLYHLETAPQADGWLNLSQAALSEMLGLSPPTVQRSLKRMQELGLIEGGYGRVRVRDRVGLMRFCGD